jgi:hypothetical protein
MLKKTIAVLLVAGVGYSIYQFLAGPFSDAPPLSENDFLLAFKGEVGLKGVMRGFGSKDQTRKYMSYGAADVPTWYKDTWSVCRKPLEGEVVEFESNIEMGPGGRLDAVCEIDADGDVFVRGWIVSVPDL